MQRIVLLLLWWVLYLSPKSIAQEEVVKYKVAYTKEGISFLVEKRGVPRYKTGLANISVALPPDRIIETFEDVAIKSLPDSTTRIWLQARVLASSRDAYLLPYYSITMVGREEVYYLRYYVYGVEDLIKCLTSENVFQRGYVDEQRLGEALKKLWSSSRVLAQRVVEEGVSMAYQQYGASAADKINDNILEGIEIDEQKGIIYRGAATLAYFDLNYKPSISSPSGPAIFDEHKNLLLSVNAPQLRSSNFFTLYPEKQVVEIIHPEKNLLVWVRIATAYLLKNGRL